MNVIPATVKIWTQYNLCFQPTAESASHHDKMNVLVNDTDGGSLDVSIMSDGNGLERTMKTV